MKRTIVLFLLITLLLLPACGCNKEKESPKVVYDDEMIELYTPSKGDTFSWVLVTGKTSSKQGMIQLDLVAENSEVLQRRGVTLAAKAPDTVEFEMNLIVKEDVAPQKARIRAYSLLVEKAGSIEAAIISCYVIPGSGVAHGAILQYYSALDTNDFEAAYGLLVAEGQSYPNLYGGEATFSPRPKLATFKAWKKDDERLRVLLLRPMTMYDLPAEGLFCYFAKIEHRIGDMKTVEDTYIFLKRQHDGFFKLYPPRKDPHKAD